MTEPINGDDLLTQIKPTLPRARVQVCLRPELIDEHARKQEELESAQGSAAQRLAGSDAKRLAQELLDLEEEIDSVSPWFEFEALPVEKYQALLVKHPPREGDRSDAMVGHNRLAVTTELVRVCLVSPTFTDEGWTELRKVCAPSEWAALCEAVNGANGRDVTPPKSRLASRLLSSPNADSK